MDTALSLEVRRRANGICEYCHIPQSVQRIRFSVDHIIARQHGGLTVADNLALCCLHCNSHKGPNITGIDPQTGQVTALFNPRTQVWQEHLSLRGAVVIGLTPVGRATVAVLAMNDPDFVALRAALIAEGVFPPGE